MYALNTFREYYPEQGIINADTYRTVCGTHDKCIDYIYTSPDISVKHGTCKILRELPVPNGKEYHWPVAIEIRLPGVSGDVPWKRRRKPYDPKKFKDPIARSTFINSLHACPSVPYECDVTSHAYIHDEYVLKTLVECFPKDKQTKKQQYISDYTHIHIQKCTEARKEWFRLQKKVANASIFAAFGIWAKLWTRARWSPLSGFSRISTITALWQAAKIAANYAKHVKGLLRLEKATWLDEQATHIEEQIAHGDLVAMHESVRVVLQFSHNKTRKHKNYRVQNSDGVCAQSYCEEH